MNDHIRRWTAAIDSREDDALISSRAGSLGLGLILVHCFAVRVWMIGTPRLDRACWKEIDYLAISYNYWQHGFHFFSPELTWPALPPRVTALELPLVPYLSAWLYAGFGYNEYTARTITLLSFLAVTVYVYRLVRRELGTFAALGAALAASLMPLYHEFGRIQFAEPPMIAMSLVALFHLAEWYDRGKRRDWWLAVLGFSLAVALKLEPLYLLLPLFWLAFRAHGTRWRQYGDFVLFVAVAGLLPLAWFSYARHLARTSMDVYGIFGGFGGTRGHNKFQTLTMLSSVRWYVALSWQISYGLLGGKVGDFLCLAGIAGACLIPRGRFFIVYLISILAYFALVAEGQIDAPYRQLPAVPVLAAFVGLGAMSLARGVAGALSRYPVFHRTGATALCIGVVLIGLMTVRRWPDMYVPRPDVPADPIKWNFAAIVRQCVGPDAKLVTLGEYTIHVGGIDPSPVLYHYTGLRGWTLVPATWRMDYVETLVAKGATHLVAEDMVREPKAAPFLAEIRRRYKTLYAAGDRLVVDLRAPASAPTPEQR